MMKIKLGKLYENILSLVSLKGLEYLLNFIIYPYLLRVLGAENFGAIVFMQSIVQYIIVLVDYGFNMTAPRCLAMARDDNEVAHLFSNILASKLILFTTITFFSLVAIWIYNFNLYTFNISLFFAVYTMVIGNIAFPIWFFQGIQQMRYITIFNVFARSIALLLIFIFVKDSSDYILAALFQSSITIFAGIFSLIILMKKYRYIFCKPSLLEIKSQFVNGWHIFLSTIAINIYTSTNIIILGFLTNNTIVGYFGAANKLIESIKGLMGAITQAVYPYISNIIKKSEIEAISFIKYFTKIYCGLCLLISILTIFLSKYIVLILFGTAYLESVLILQILSVIPFIVSISNVFGIQGLINFGYQKIFSKILLQGAVLDFIIIWPLTFVLEAKGIAITMIVVETYVSIFTMYYFKRYVY